MTRRVPDILQVMDDPKTFGRFFKGDSWNAWRAYLAAKHALPMTPAMHDIFVACTGRTRPPARRVLRCANIDGRRSGKDTIEGFEVAYDAVFIDYRPFLAPGENVALICVAVDRKQAGVLFSRIEAYFDEIPMLRRLVTERTKESLTLGTRRVVIMVMTASHRSIRGQTAGRFSLSECAFLRDESSANPDVELVRAAEPAMATIPTATLNLLSTPYARNGLLWQWFDKYYGEDRDDILIWKAPTWVMNPTVPQSVIDAAFEDDPISAAAEYGADFRTDVSGFIDAETVDAAIMRGCYERPPQPGVKYAAFIDPSGGRHDSMCLGIASHDRDRDVTTLDCVREVVPPFNPDAVCAEFATTMKSYGVTTCQADRWGGVFVQGKLAEHGIRCDQSADAKSEMYLRILPLLNSSKIALLDVRKLRLQLLALERRTSKSGKDAVAEPRNAHDDVVNAATGALLLAVDQGAFVAVPPINITRISPWSDSAPLSDTNGRW